MPAPLIDVLNPYRRRAAELRSKIRDYGEACRVAAEAGNTAMVRSLQAGMREMYLQLLVAAAVDGLFGVLPHVLALAALTEFAGMRRLPGLDPVNVPCLYLAGAAAFYLARWLRRRGAGRRHADP